MNSRTFLAEPQAQELQSFPQRGQYPLIQEYTLNHNDVKAPYNLRYIPYLRGIGLFGSFERPGSRKAVGLNAV